MRGTYHGRVFFFKSPRGSSVSETLTVFLATKNVKTMFLTAFFVVAMFLVLFLICAFICGRRSRCRGRGFCRRRHRASAVFVDEQRTGVCQTDYFSIIAQRPKSPNRGNKITSSSLTQKQLGCRSIFSLSLLPLT